MHFSTTAPLRLTFIRSISSNQALVSRKSKQYFVLLFDFVEGLLKHAPKILSIGNYFWLSFTGVKYLCKVTDSVLVLFGKLWPWMSVKWGVLHLEVCMSLSFSLLIKTKLNIRMVFVLCPLPQQLPSVYKPFAVSLLSIPHPREGAPPSESECNQHWKKKKTLFRHTALRKQTSDISAGT